MEIFSPLCEGDQESRRASSEVSQNHIPGQLPPRLDDEVSPCLLELGPGTRSGGGESCAGSHTMWYATRMKLHRRVWSVTPVPRPSPERGPASGVSHTSQYTRSAWGS